jgi:hypothetical protein
MTSPSSRPIFDLSDPKTLLLDLVTPKLKDVVAIHEAFVADMKANPDPGKLPVKTGWNKITPEIAINLLRRNKPGANRWIDPATVYYYAQQMARDDWKETGQGILVDKEGWLLDGQHRLYALLISGTAITSFVVTDVKPAPNLFVYIDNARTRTAATALQTKGFNGLSSIITGVLRFAEEVKAGIYDATRGASKLARMSPAQYLALVDNYPNVQAAAHSVASDWSAVVERLPRRKDVVSYVGMRIIDEHGEAIADDFFADLTDGNERDLDHPVTELHREIERDEKRIKKLKKQHVAAMLILVFNAWFKHETMAKRWMQQVNEDFPTLVAGQREMADAAE